MKSAFTAILMALSLGASAQTPPVTDEPAKRPAPKKVEAAPKKPQPPKKVEAPKKPAAKKPVSKAPPKSLEPARGGPEMKVYKNSADAPTLRDKSGNAIPNNPGDYDVSSATKKK